MKIAVVGAGIIGITTAWELAADGHDVTVFERHHAAAEESSFGTAGLLSTAAILPWSGSGFAGKLMRGWFGAPAPLHSAMPLSAQELRWLWRWSRQSQAQCASRLAWLHQLAHYSRTLQTELHHNLQLEYEVNTGVLVLFRSDFDSKHMQLQLQWLRDAGTVFASIDAATARAIEPALGSNTELAGAIHFPQDEVANCRQFALQLKMQAQRRGVQFAFGCAVRGMGGADKLQLQVLGEDAPRSFDKAVVCAGAAGSAILKSLGYELPMVAVRGYSVSAPIQEMALAPHSAVVDARYMVSLGRQGLRLRVAGGAHVGGRSGQVRANSVHMLYRLLRDWFPGAARLSSGVQEWMGTYPTLPSGIPLIGASKHPHVWLNLGHGSSGWTLACGSARLVADLMVGKKPQVAWADGQAL